MIDLHCDTVWAIAEEKKKKHTKTDTKEKECSLQRSFFQIDEEKLVKGGYMAQCFAMFVPNDGEERFQRCVDLIGLYYAELNRCERLASAYSYADLIENRKNKKISAILTVEDGCPIGNRLENVRKLYDFGVRMACLTWNYPNAIGYPNVDASKPEKVDPFTPDSARGLTDFGKEVVKEMQKLGMIVDVSHLSDAGFYDVAKISQKPFVASHSNARGLCPHVRNLTDSMLKKIADVGGMVGLTYVKGFLHTDKALGAKTLDRLVEHIRYVRRVAGVECIALGSDFDGADRDIELSDAAEAPRLVSRLEKEGFSTAEIEKITYQNALRVFKDCFQP